jgi:hypothetical protein
MSEGELKKRISEDYIADLLIEFGPDGHMDGSDVITDKIWQVLDEAKKDLLDGMKGIYPPDHGEIYNDWFVKWFGNYDKQ